LALLERDIATRSGTLPAERWLSDLDRIERSVARINIPAGYASEAYTLRQHIVFVRDAVTARINSASSRETRTLIQKDTPQPGLIEDCDDANSSKY
jgi:hypothetical protein